MGIISMIKNRMADEEESVIKRRGMEKWHRPGDVSEQGKEQYKREISEMSQPEREKERKMRVQEKRGMSEWHTGGSEIKQKIKKGGTIGIHAEREPETLTERQNKRYFAEQAEVKKYVENFQGKERAEIAARIRGFKSAEEEKELNTRKARELFNESAKRDYEYHYNPKTRYEETVAEIKDKIELAKLKAKKLATPAGLAGGLINVISPIKTRDEKIKEERKKQLKEQQIEKRRELLEKRSHEVEVAAAYGSGRIPRQKVVVKRVRVGTSPLRGAFGMGGFSLGGRPQRPMQRVVTRGQSQVVTPVERRPSEPFGLSAYSGSPAPRRMEQRRAEPIRTEQRRPERVVIRQVPRPSVPVVGDISFVSIGTNPVNDRSANNLVNINGSRELVSMKKTGKSTDPFGASNYF